MKHYTSLFTALNMVISFFHMYGMETDQFLKKFSTLRKEMNEFIKGNPKANKSFIIRTIEEMRDAGILNRQYYYYDYVYNTKTKPYIIEQFFTYYPQQICPELQSIVDSIDDKYDRQDFLTILSTIKTKNAYTKQYSNQIIKVIKNQEDSSTSKKRMFKLKDKTMNVIHQALDAICSNLNDEDISQKEHVPINKDKKKEIALLTKINRQQKLLGDLLPIEESINNPHHFAFFFNKLNEKIDPKDEPAIKLLELYKQRLDTEAINSINAIISKYQLISEQLQLVEERFHTNSARLLKKTVAHNQHILERHPELLDYFQKITPEEPNVSEEELPNLLLETESTKTNIPRQKPFAYSIKSTSKKQPGSIQNKMSDIETKPQQPEEPTGWFARLQNGITTMATTITNFFRNIYRYFFR